MPQFAAGLPGDNRNLRPLPGAQPAQCQSIFNFKAHFCHGTGECQRVAAEIRLDRTTLVRNLKPLEQQGLIHDIAQSGTRNRQLCLTAVGRERIEQANAYWELAQKRIEAQLGLEDTKTLQALLFKN